MILAVDFNVVFSALVTSGKSRFVFELNDILDKFEFISTQYMYSELNNNLDKIISLSKLSKGEILEVLEFIKGSVEIIPFNVFEDKAKEAVSIAPHLKDAPYVAISLKFDCKILSGDKGLKKVLPDKVFTPSEALDALLGKSNLTK
ncbi:MAG: PIN domain-containing protein [Nanoarchaeota archaeon]